MMASSPTTTASPLSPKATTNPDGSFFLASTDWITLQTYLQAAVTLPITGAEAIAKLGINSADADYFAPLWSAYSGVHDHCHDFSINTFPETVSLASDIVDYGRNKVPVFYGAISKIADKVSDGVLTEEKAQVQITQVLTNLVKDAQTRGDRAAAVEAAIASFIAQTQADKALLDPLQTRYRNELEGDNGRIAELEADLATEQAVIDSENAEYAKDVKLAATTPTYGWIVPAGTIAAAVVAGIYGARATAALRAMRDAQDQFDKDFDELASKRLMAQDLTTAGSSLDGVLTALNSALPIVQKARGAWHALSDDIGSVLKTLANDIGGQESFIASLGVDTAISEWSELAKKADTYRANAFITVLSEAEVTARIAADPNAFAVSHG
ncbi:Pesticidial crystal protein cry6Aa [hydrothermal vent metagenome]|uniref:Pesticidial crystal protein cry6Aa n=1 Tax=hydrothermal vent metagenome TaxID=652676 RepID=A0A160THJ4_9ZZZZ